MCFHYFAPDFSHMNINSISLDIACINHSRISEYKDKFGPFRDIEFSDIDIQLCSERLIHVWKMETFPVQFWISVSAWLSFVSFIELVSNKLLASKWSDPNRIWGNENLNDRSGNRNGLVSFIAQIIWFHRTQNIPQRIDWPLRSRTSNYY